MADPIVNLGPNQYKGKDKDEVEVNIEEVGADVFLPDILVLGPGGIKGFYYCGALSFFEEERILVNVGTIVGCSVGSILGLLINAKYTCLEILSEAASIDLFVDINSIKLENIKNNIGLMSNTIISDKLNFLMKKSFGRIPTFSQLYDETGIRFSVVTYNLTQRKPVYMSAKTHPDMSVVEAVLLSCNIPVFFHQARYNGDVYIDGAFVNPYPIDLFDDENIKTLGLFVDSIPNPSELVQENTSFKSIISYISSVAYSSIGQIRKMLIRSVKSECRHLQLKTPIVGLSTDMTSKYNMWKEGYEKARQFYNSGFNDEELRASLNIT